jgi:hypothetical protein
MHVCSRVLLVSQAAGSGLTFVDCSAGKALHAKKTLTKDDLA